MGKPFMPKSNPGTSIIGFCAEPRWPGDVCDNLEVLHANRHRQVHSKSELLKNPAASRKGR